jgi:hypothetical protein
MRRSRWLRLVALGLALASALLCGCTRKAPGPDECQRFAELAARMSTDSPLLTPELQAQIDEETRQCLTKPYDRELLSCVETTREAHRCLTAFRLRHERSQ